MILHLVRHAETSWNRIARIQGQKQIGLSKRGIVQAEKLSEKLNSLNFDEIYSSDLKRSIQTAEIINRQYDLTIKMESGLREISYGEWEGKLWSTIYSANSHLNNSWKSLGINFSSPGGESAVEFRNRAIKTLKSIITNSRGTNVMLVTHEQVIKMILTCFRKVKDSEIFTFLELENCAIVTIGEMEMETFSSKTNYKFGKKNNKCIG